MECLDRLPEDLKSLGVPRQFEYAEDADESDDPENGERHGFVARRPAVLGDRGAEREEVRRDGDDVDDVHGVAKEQDVVGRRREPHEQFDGEPDDAGGLDDEERFCEERHVVVVLQRDASQEVGRRRRRVAAGRSRRRRSRFVVGRGGGADDAEAPEVRQRLETKDDDGDQYHND